MWLMTVQVVNGDRHQLASAEATVTPGSRRERPRAALLPRHRVLFD